jgi:putative thioredoxin
MIIDVTDATFEAEVLARSDETPVVVDLWAPWCGPCKQLGPLLEQAVQATNGQVVLAKVNVDESPQVAQMFQVQSIPAVFALFGRRVVDGFVGAQGEAAVREFVSRLLPTEEEAALAELVTRGDEASLRQALEIDPGFEPAVLGLAQLLVDTQRGEEALQLLARIPDSPESRHIAALARTHVAPDDDYEAQLTALLDQVKEDDDARQRYVDLLELMGPLDPRTAVYRRKLTSRLF